MHYTPHIDLAFNSVEYIMRDVNNADGLFGTFMQMECLCFLLLFIVIFFVVFILVHVCNLDSYFGVQELLFLY